MAVSVVVWETVLELSLCKPSNSWFISHTSPMRMWAEVLDAVDLLSGKFEGWKLSFFQDWRLNPHRSPPARKSAECNVKMVTPLSCCERWTISQDTTHFFCLALMHTHISREQERKEEGKEGRAPVQLTVTVLSMLLSAPQSHLEKHNDP